MESSEWHYRIAAKAHVDAARALLTSDSQRAPIYACLELRMAIEALTYDLLQLYPFEVSRSAMEKWTPKQVLSELLYIDEDATSDRTVTIIPRAGKTLNLGEEKRFSIAWAAKSHNALGNMLHHPTPAQGRKSSVEIARAAEKKAHEIAARLDEILSSNIAHFRVRRLVEIDCQCGFKIARDVTYLEAGKKVVCAQCGRQYLYEIQPDKRVRFVLEGGTFNCPACGEKHLRPIHELVPGHTLACSACKKTIRFTAGVNLEVDS